MITIAKGKSFRVTTEPDDDDHPSKDLVDKMRAELHELREKEKKNVIED